MIIKIINQLHYFLIDISYILCIYISKYYVIISCYDLLSIIILLLYIIQYRYFINIIYEINYQYMNMMFN